jgi:futalosine hydrolase
LFFFYSAKETQKNGLLIAVSQCCIEINNITPLFGKLNRKVDLCIMHILLLSATPMEQPEIHVPQGIQLERLVHGCGLMESTFHISKALNKPYDWLIQVGLAGTYTNTLTLGQTVVVGTEQLGDTGAENQDGTPLSLFDLGLANPNTPPFSHSVLPNPHQEHFPKHLQVVHALTVNQSSGSAASVAHRQAQKAHIETMEGAAFHYVALQAGYKFIQLRGISNLVEPRNRSAWQIPQAMMNVKKEVQHFIQSLATS